MLFTLFSLFALVPYARAQESSATTDPARSADSPYWHDRYHGILASSTFDHAYRTQCQLFFTADGVQHNFAGSTEAPWTLLGEWGPTPSYNLTAFAAVIPEMNKVVFVVGDHFGFERFNATQVPLLGVGCDANCTVHAAAFEAAEELRNATQDFQVIRQNLGQHIWSSAGIGFGGMVQQVLALQTNVNRVAGHGFEASHSFGSPAVFNAAAAELFNQRFQGSSSVRNVANGDSWPRFGLNTSATSFVQTGMHMWNQTDPIFSQSWTHCMGPQDEECHGGAVPEDHFFYTQAGTCGENYDVQAYSFTRQHAFLERLRAHDVATFGSPLPTGPITTASSMPPITSPTPDAASPSTLVAPSTATSPQSGVAVPMAPVFGLLAPLSLVAVGALGL